MTRTDTERLDFLENLESGCGVVHDDNRHWAVATTGFQSMVTGDDPMDFDTSFMVEASECRRTIREAIDAAMDAEEAEAKATT